MARALYLGKQKPLTPGASSGCLVPPHHLVTHTVITGMTGSGKTGLVMVLVEEALRSQIPVLMVDVKGDLANLLLTFPPGTPGVFTPWLDASAPGQEGRPVEAVALELATRRDEGLLGAGLTSRDLEDFRAGTRVRVLTPGSTAGEPVHLLSSLERRSRAWDTDLETARASLSSAVSLVLRLVGRDADPARSREHVALTVLAERRLRANQPADLASLLGDLEAPPLERLGAQSFEDFLPKGERRSLCSALNALLASPTFATWREGASLDVASWLSPVEGKTPAVIVSVAHLDDQERSLVLGLLLDEVLAHVRGLPGTSALKALVVFDEVYGFLPPHPANPPTKRPLVALMKQARAFGVGMVLATQNPMDLDYRALSNAGLWFLGRLQTDADRARVVDGLASGEAGTGESKAELAATLRRLARRWFVMRNLHAQPGTALLYPRHTLSWLRGPLTRLELLRALKQE